MDETRDPFGGDRTMNDADRLPAGHALPGADVRPGDSTIYNSGSEVSGSTGGGNGALADDPDATRAEIEQTRARMSETIDEIEEQLLRRKQTLEEKLDVKAQVRERLAPVRARLAPIQEEVHRRPLLVFGGVFGTGLLLGYLTGGDDDDRPRRSGGDAEYDGGTDVRARRWEEQSRRLMRQNSEQEEELRRLRARLEEAERQAARREERQERIGGWRGSLGSAIGGIFGGLLGQIRGRDEEEEYDVEVEVRATGSYDNYSPSTSYEAGAYPRRYGTGYTESEYGGTGFAAGGASFAEDDYPQRGFNQGAHYDSGLEDGGYESSTDYRPRNEYDRGDR
jgi:hypothetical protein